MAKGTVVRGTPINSYGPNGGGVSANNGFNPQLPMLNQVMDGTVNPQFRGDQTHKIDPRSGTPATHQTGNVDQASTLRFSGKYGVSPIAGGVDSNNPSSNGNGTILDHVSEARDYTPWLPIGQGVMDSPVALGAQMPAEDGSNQLNALRNGTGKTYSEKQQIPDELVKVGGVMSRDD
jgi:hypothetical protein